MSTQPTKPWYYESDGGPCAGIDFPKTYYVVNRYKYDSRIDCPTKRAALALRDKLNKEERS